MLYTWCIPNTSSEQSKIRPIPNKKVTDSLALTLILRKSETLLAFQATFSTRKAQSEEVILVKLEAFWKCYHNILDIKAQEPLIMSRIHCEDACIHRQSSMLLVLPIILGHVQREPSHARLFQLLLSTLRQPACYGLESEAPFSTQS